jgi:segregation and condensation protein B
MYRERNKQKLSIAALETLAIVAYKQPITKVEIEAIRGVNADAVTRNLTNLGFVKIEGRKEVVGRPFLFVTTRKFLEYFGLNSLRDLPKLEEFVALAGTEDIVQETADQPQNEQIIQEDNTQEDTGGQDDTPQENNNVDGSNSI